MRVILQELMSDYARELVFIHVASAILWVGGMMVLRIVVAPSIRNLTDETIRQARSLEIMQKFFKITFHISLSILVTAIIFIIGLNIKAVGGEMYKLVMIKEALWMVMFGLFLTAYFKRNKAQKLFVSGDTEGTRKHILVIEKILFANIILGLIAVYLGIALRGY